MKQEKVLALWFMDFLDRNEFALDYITLFVVNFNPVDAMELSINKKNVRVFLETRFPTYLQKHIEVNGMLGLFDFNIIDNGTDKKVTEIIDKMNLLKAKLKDCLQETPYEEIVKVAVKYISDEQEQ